MVRIARSASARTAPDPDPGTTLTYSVSGGTNPAQFVIDSATGVLGFASPIDYESNSNHLYAVDVQVSDGAATATIGVSVWLTDVNEPPTITSDGGGDTAAISIPENTTAVTIVTATDPDVFAGAMLSRSIIGGADAALFTIDYSTGTLTFVEGPDTHVLEAGDCLQLGPPASCTFANRTRRSCRYLVAVARR